MGTEITSIHLLTATPHNGKIPRTNSQQSVMKYPGTPMIFERPFGHWLNTRTLTRTKQPRGRQPTLSPRTKNGHFMSSPTQHYMEKEIEMRCPLTANDSPGTSFSIAGDLGKFNLSTYEGKEMKKHKSATNYGNRNSNRS